MKTALRNPFLILMSLTLFTSLASAGSGWNTLDTYQGMCNVQINYSGEVLSLKEISTNTVPAVEISLRSPGTSSTELSPTLHKTVSSRGKRTLVIEDIDAKTLIASADLKILIESLLDPVFKKGGSYSKLTNSDLLVAEIRKCPFQ